MGESRELSDDPSYLGPARTPSVCLYVPSVRARYRSYRTSRASPDAHTPHARVRLRPLKSDVTLSEPGYCRAVSQYSDILGDVGDRGSGSRACTAVLRVAKLYR